MTPEKMSLAALVVSTIASVVVAIAVVWQAVFSKRLTTLQKDLVEAETGTLKLQQSLFEFQKDVEKARNRVEVFATVKRGKLDSAPHQEPQTALLYIANLCAVGIWVEEADVIVNEQSRHASARKRIERLLAPYEVYWATVEDQIREALILTAGSAEGRVTVRCEIAYWATGETKTYQMPRAYTVELASGAMRGVREVE